MQISELSAASGVSIATLKFYLREGMLKRGKVIAPTRADYGREHLDRVGLISALTNVRGLPVAKVRAILSIIDGPQDDPIEAMGIAVGALPPYQDWGDGVRYPRAEATLRSLNFAFDPSFPATRQLEAALEGIERAGLEWNDDVIDRYREALVPLAVKEIAPMKTMKVQDAVVYAVLGTALYEPVIMAIRRLAHRHLFELESEKREE